MTITPATTTNDDHNRNHHYLHWSANDTRINGQTWTLWNNKYIPIPEDPTHTVESGGFVAALDPVCTDPNGRGNHATTVDHYQPLSYIYI